MHKKIPKICTGCRVSEAKIYLYHSTEIAKARPHSEVWQTDTSVQKQWSMPKHTARKYGIFRGVLSNFLPLFSHQHATFPRFINHVRTGTQCVLPSIYICSASVKMLGGNYYTAGYSSIFFLQLKVSKFQKQIFLFSFEPKKERNCFLMP